MADDLAGLSVPWLRISASDSVAVALQDLTAGYVVAVDGHEVILRNDVPKGHKIALKDIRTGDEVIKLGFSIGKASQAIAAGEHVHAHNLITALSGLEDYSYQPTPVASPALLTESTFQG